MAEYIEREDILHRFTYEHGDYIPEVDANGFPNMVSVKDIRNIIREIPAADVAEVRHGKWVPVQEYPNNPWYRECSECGRAIETIKRSKYCPNCGAKMEG